MQKMNLPKYKQIEEDIINQIVNHELNNGDKLPSEGEIADAFSVSRMTVNKALNNLERAGYIVKRRGSGSYVNYFRISKNFNASRSFTNDIRSIGETPRSDVLEYKIVRASDYPEIKQKLKLKDEDYLHYFSRLRFANNVPVAISHSYVAQKIIPTINIKKLEASFYNFLNEEYQIKPKAAYFDIGAHIVTEKEKELLNVSDVAILDVGHVGYLIDGTPFKYTKTHYLADRFYYLSSPDSAFLENKTQSDESL